MTIADPSLGASTVFRASKAQVCATLGTGLVMPATSPPQLPSLLWSARALRGTSGRPRARRQIRVLLE